jgi:PAS domain S-box-containing protein
VVKLATTLDDACRELVASLQSKDDLIFSGPTANSCVLRADKAILVTLIVKEAVSNAVNYAHPTGIPGRITVSCSRDSEGVIAIEVADDGVGLPEDFNPETDGSIGFQVMRALSRRLEASLTFTSTDLGLHVALRVPLDAEVKAARTRSGPAERGSPGTEQREGPLPDGSGATRGAVNMLADTSGHKRVGRSVANPRERHAVDITELKRADHSAHLLAAIVETSNDAIVSKDLNGIVTSWNRGAERIFGYTVEEMIGASIAVLIPHERHDEELGILERIRRGERIDHYETIRRRKDGSLVDISLAISPVKDTAGKVVGASKIARDITERKQLQARQDLLAREIQHRTRNLFAVVLAVVARSFAGKHTVKDAESAVLSRLHSLAETHAMLLGRDWQGADLAEVVRTEMKPYADRVHTDGPSLVLNAEAAQNFALALHELATNAAKHGALSNSAGRVHIKWAMAKSNGASRFTFRWHERGGPAVSQPAQRGFGSAVLEQVMTEYFEVPPRIDFAVGGLSYELSGSLDAVMADDGTPDGRRQ